MEAIIGPCRDQKFCEARFTAMLLLREQGFGYKKIADQFKRDHASAMWACKRARNWSEVYPKYAAKVGMIRKAIGEQSVLAVAIE